MNEINYNKIYTVDDFEEILLNHYENQKLISYKYNPSEFYFFVEELTKIEKINGEKTKAYLVDKDEKKKLNIRYDLYFSSIQEISDFMEKHKDKISEKIQKYFQKRVYKLRVIKENEMIYNNSKYIKGQPITSIKQLYEKLYEDGIIYDNGNKAFSKTIIINVNIPDTNYHYPIKLRIFAKDINKKNIEEMRKVEIFNDKDYLNKIESIVQNIINNYNFNTKYTEKHFTFLINSLNANKQKVDKIIMVAKASEVLDINRYEHAFPLARKLNRNFQIIYGPTNSGKTYHALEQLKKAKSGIYLAPLRLLALEIFEKLNKDGIKCSLITGEERIIIDNASHISSTIEMADYSTIFETAVIDETQMIFDEVRGVAWTSAIIGIAANNVITIGSPIIKQPIIEITSFLNEEYELIEKKRMSDLIVDNHIYSTNTSIKKGDVFICFSRKNVLAWAEYLKTKGYKPSVIYGALSPEVRRKQTELFLSNKNNVLVSTDAIGMGLNLPTNRIIFTEIEKFDGIDFRCLNTTEIKQIGGRAGRGNENGLICGLDNNIINYLSKEFHNKDIQSRFKISPNKWHILKLKEILKTNSIEKILTFFMSEIMVEHEYFYIEIIETHLNVASLVDYFLKDNDIIDKFIFSCAPLSLKEEDEITYFKELLYSFANNEKHTTSDIFVTGDLEFLEFQSKMLS